MSQRAAASSQRIYAIFDEISEIVDPHRVPRICEISEGRIEFDAVSFGYAERRRRAEKPRPRVEPGETVAIVGRTGSAGSRPCMRLLPRFYDVRQGSGPRSTASTYETCRVESLRREIGLVLDEPFLFSESIHDNIAYARPDATREEVEAAARQRRRAPLRDRARTRLRHGGRRARLHALGWTAPAHRHRAHAARETRAFWFSTTRRARST